MAGGPDATEMLGPHASCPVPAVVVSRGGKGGAVSGEPTPDEAEEWNQEMARERAEEGEKAKVAEYAGHEVELLQEMREAIKAEGVTVEGVADKDLMRFLVARGMSVPKASKLYIDDVKWRAEYLAPPGILPSEIEPEMKANKSYIIEKKGERTWIYMIGRNHDLATRDMEQFHRFAVWVMETAINSLPPGIEKFGCVLDLKGAGYKNLDSRGIVSIFDTLQAHFPERMIRLYVLHVPYIFWGVWKVIKPLIDPKTRQKIRFVGDNELAQVLLKDMPEDMLPKAYGGKAEFKGHWEKYGLKQK